MVEAESFAYLLVVDIVVGSDRTAADFSLEIELDISAATLDSSDSVNSSDSVGSFDSGNCSTVASCTVF